MNGYSEDLRKRIVSAVQRGMSKSQAARTFSVSLSSVKRYDFNKADRGESLAPKKSPDLCSETGREGKEATRR
jgi:transposase